jgi:chorismate synthase
MIRFITAGESHGKAVSVIVDGLPAGIKTSAEHIHAELARRQRGYGRGKRMKIEKDQVDIIAGIRGGLTTGAPVHLMIVNRDHNNWLDVMDTRRSSRKKGITAPRPGHADFVGYFKYGLKDIRDVLERASARETASRVAAGAVFKQFLKVFDITFSSQTLTVGQVRVRAATRTLEQTERGLLRCPDPIAEREMMDFIDVMQKKGETVGGVVEVLATGVCPGLGSYTLYDRRLDARIALACMSIPSVKGVEIGPAYSNAAKPGSEVHDEIFYAKEKGFYRLSNRAGGIEGGMSNGEDIIVRLIVKPIPTLAKPLRSADVRTKQRAVAQKERADVCVVPAVGVIGEAMLAYVISDAYLEKFGSDCLVDIQRNHDQYQQRMRNV